MPPLGDHFPGGEFAKRMLPLIDRLLVIFIVATSFR